MHFGRRVHSIPKSDAYASDKYRYNLIGTVPLWFLAVPEYVAFVKSVLIIYAMCNALS